MHRINDIDSVGSENQRWKLIETREVFMADPWVKVHVDTIKLPGGRIVDDYYRIELPEYVMVYAQRQDGRVLLEKIYKHAIGDISFVLPTGCMEVGETTIETAKRELLEETGYEAELWNYVTSFVVDGNKGSGKGHFYIAENLNKVAEPVVDDMEQAEIIFMDPEAALETLLNGDVYELASTALLSMATNPIVNKMLNKRGVQ